MQTLKTTIRLLLKRSLPGSKQTLEGHIERGTLIATAIQQRFGISTPYQWQLKHLIWYFKTQLTEHKSATRYDYWRTCRAVASVLGKWQHWERVLMPFNPHNQTNRGGRPAKLAFKGQSRNQ